MISTSREERERGWNVLKFPMDGLSIPTREDQPSRPVHLKLLS